MNTLLSDIETFCSVWGMSEWQFGEQALNDRHFIRQLREGRDVRLSTLARVKAFMSDHRSAQGEDGQPPFAKPTTAPARTTPEKSVRNIPDGSASCSTSLPKRSTASGNGSGEKRAAA